MQRGEYESVKADEKKVGVTETLGVEGVEILGDGTRYRRGRGHIGLVRGGRRESYRVERKLEDQVRERTIVGQGRIVSALV